MNEMLVLTRAIHFGSALWLFGEFVFFVFVLGPAPGGAANGASIQEHRRRLLRIAAGCIVVGIASSVIWLLLEATNMSGAAIAVAVNPDTLGTVIRKTVFGHIWLARLAVSLSLGALLWWIWRQHDRPMNPAVIVAATILAGTYVAALAGTGHAAAHVGADRYWHGSSDVVHLLAAGAWVGALPGLISLLKGTGADAISDRLTLAVAATRRFSTVGQISVSALVVTGIVNVCYLVGSIAALFGTGYGRLLLWKLLLFGGMVALAAVNRLYLTPRLAMPASSTSAAAHGTALSRLRRNALLELAAGVAIVAIVAALGLTIPAMHMHDGQGMPSMPMEERAR